MMLTERVCLVRLTSIGVRALEGVVAVTEKGSFEAWVKEQDERGVWLNPIGMEESGERRGKLILLVKWDYLATIQTIEE